MSASELMLKWFSYLWRTLVWFTLAFLGERYGLAALGSLLVEANVLASLGEFLVNGIPFLVHAGIAGLLGGLLLVRGIKLLDMAQAYIVFLLILIVEQGVLWMLSVILSPILYFGSITQFLVDMPLAVDAGLALVLTVPLFYYGFERVETLIDQTITRRYIAIILIGFVIIFLLLLPYHPSQSNYNKLIYIGAFYWAILAASWALLAGISGQFSFAHIAFVGIGAYTAGLLARDGLSIGFLNLQIPATSFSAPGSILIGSIVAALAGLLVGALVLRLRSSYLALFTIAFSELFRIVVLTEFSYTGGMNGLSLRRLVVTETPEAARTSGYFIMFFLLIGSLVVIYLVANSRVGLFLRAMREDEDAASALGVNVVFYKMLIFVFTSFLVGLAGSVFFSNVGAERITPDALKILQMSLVIAFAVVGSMESPLGAAIGAFAARYLLEEISVVTFDPPFGINLPYNAEVLQFTPGALRFAIFGVILVLTLRFARNGLLFPILQWFQGRSLIEQETVAKRDAGAEDDGLEMDGAS